jgi:hypothetical protein
MQSFLASSDVAALAVSECQGMNWKKVWTCVAASLKFNWPIGRYRDLDHDDIECSILLCILENAFPTEPLLTGKKFTIQVLWGSYQVLFIFDLFSHRYSMSFKFHQYE